MKNEELGVELAAAEIASRIPELARDSATNNALVIANIIRESILQVKPEAAGEVRNSLPAGEVAP